MIKGQIDLIKGLNYMSPLMLISGLPETSPLKVDMSKSMTVVKSNSIIDASYRLSLNEQRLILMCIASIERGQNISEHDPFLVNAHDFAEKFDLPLTNAYRDLQTVADRLYERSVTIYNPDPDNPDATHLRTRWISSVTYLPRKGELTIGFARQMIPYISMLKGRFTRYSLDAITGMSSTYGMRFYELMKKWQTETGTTKNEKKISVDELKGTLDLQGKYKAIKDFKLKVVEPAIRDINDCSDLIASYTQEKTGRKVTHLIFTFKENEQLQIPFSGSKGQRPKVTKAYIERHARAGESYGEARERLNRENTH